MEHETKKKLTVRQVANLEALLEEHRWKWGCDDPEHRKDPHIAEWCRLLDEALAIVRSVKFGDSRDDPDSLTDEEVAE